MSKRLHNSLVVVVRFLGACFVTVGLTGAYGMPIVRLPPPQGDLQMLLFVYGFVAAWGIMLIASVPRKRV